MAKQEEQQERSIKGDLSNLQPAFDMPEKPAAEAVSVHQGSHSESQGQPPAEVGDPLA
jgi:hypothetical protein